MNTRRRKTVRLVEPEDPVIHSLDALADRIERLTEPPPPVPLLPEGFFVPKWMMSVLVAVMLSAGAWMVATYGEIRVIRAQITDIFERRMDSQSERIRELNADLIDLQHQLDNHEQIDNGREP